MPSKDKNKRREYERKYEQSEKGTCVRKVYKTRPDLADARRSRYLKAYKKAKHMTDYYVCGAGKLSSLKKSASDRGLSFSLTEEELRHWWQVTPDVCDYCRMTLDDYRKFRDFIVNYQGNNSVVGSFTCLLKSENRQAIDQLTVDRADSKLGYDIGNMVKCCWFCNTIKHRFLSAKHMKLIASEIIGDLKAAIDTESRQDIGVPVGPLGYFQQTFVAKGWGREQWLYNGDYCGKILFIEKGKKVSWHYHNLKDEVFYIQDGSMLVLYGQDDDINKANQAVMNPGDVFHVPVGMRHRMIGLEDTHVLEFSTHHEDSDSIRLERGD